MYTVQDPMVTTTELFTLMNFSTWVAVTLTFTHHHLYLYGSDENRIYFTTQVMRITNGKVWLVSGQKHLETLNNIKISNHLNALLMWETQCQKPIWQSPGEHYIKVWRHQTLSFQYDKKICVVLLWYNQWERECHN